MIHFLPDPELAVAVPQSAAAIRAGGLEATAPLAETDATADPAAALLADAIREALDEMGALLSL